MKNFILSALFGLLVLSNSSLAAVIQCGSGERTAFIGDVSALVDCKTGSKNPKKSDIDSYFGGSWEIIGELESDSGAGFIGDEIFSAIITHGTWGSAPVAGTWSIGSSFWDSNDSAVISMHIGNGGGEPDHFAWGLITADDSSGFFGIGFEWQGTTMDDSFPSDLSISGAGLSNIKLWGENPVVVPVPAAVWLFGTALIGFVGMSRRTSV